MIDRHSTTDVGAEVLRRCDQMTVKLYRRDDGSIDSTFEIVGSTLFKDDDDEGDTVVDQTADLQFLRQLMKAFEGEPK